MGNILNRRVLIAVFICAVFLCGIQLATAEPIHAATYKKIDSGKINKVKYVTYMKGNSKIYMKLSYKGINAGKIYITRGKTKLTISTKLIGSKTQTQSFNDGGLIGLRAYYNEIKKVLNKA